MYKTARNLVLKRLSATAERYIAYLIHELLFAVVENGEVHIRTIIISHLQEKIRSTRLIVECQVDIHGTAMSLELNILGSI